MADLIKCAYTGFVASCAGNDIFKLLIRSGYMITYEKLGERLRFLEMMPLHY